MTSRLTCASSYWEAFTQIYFFNLEKLAFSIYLWLYLELVKYETFYQTTTEGEVLFFFSMSYSKYRWLDLLYKGSVLENCDTF